MKKILTFIGAMLLFLASASAQELASAYFLDDRYIYGYRINPSRMPNEGTFSHIGFLIDNTTFSLNTNVGMSNFIFPVNGILTTGLNSKVAAKDFLDPLPDVTRIGSGFSQSLLTLGSRTGIGFLTLEVNLVSDTQISIPKKVFEILKLGTSAEGEQNLGGLGLDTSSYLEVAANQSVRINDNVNIGIGIKGLVGLIDGRYDVNKFSLGSLEINPLMLFQFANSILDFRFGGFGAALDLGVNWKLPVEGLSVDAAVLNAGGIFWRRNFEDDTVLDFNRIPLTVNLGSRYTLPFYDRISAGVFSTMRVGKTFFFDVRGGFEITPLDVMGIAFSVGGNSFGPAAGGIINLRFPGVNLFAGMDAVFTKFTPQMVPVGKINTTVKTGLAIVIGNAKEKHKN